jgi:hypothetical protein
MPATDAGVRLSAAEGAGEQQVQSAAAVIAESVETSLMTVLPAEAVPAPAIEVLGYQYHNHAVYGHGSCDWGVQGGYAI